MNATVKYTAPIIVILTIAGMTGCSDMSRRDQDTAAGAGIGGLAGAVFTGGSPAATVGGAAIGGVIGNQAGKDK
jgi:osmotically inducible lipoprotein OsmB